MGRPPTQPIQRLSVRAVLLRPDRRVLLARYVEPGTGFQVWTMPGGGIEAGEDRETCLRREVREETGYDLKAVGPFIWRRHHDFTWEGRAFAQDEEYYVVDVEPFTPQMVANPSAVEARAFREFKWWAADEIAESTDVFAPHRLARFLGELLRDGPPEEPVDVGV